MPKRKTEVSRPNEVVLFETELGLKFVGPYNDGREWDSNIFEENNIKCMLKIAEIAQWLKEKGFTKKSNEVNSNFSFKLKKGVHLGIDVVNDGLQITLYYDN